MAFLSDIPGRIFLVAATLPLVAAILLFLANCLKSKPATQGSWGGWLAVYAMAASAACSIVGTIWLFQEPFSNSNRWSETITLLKMGHQRTLSSNQLIEFGFAIDKLAALMMSMVTIVGTLIFLFSLGYMNEELKRVNDHEAHAERRGRFTHFFCYLSFFAFSMLQLIIADNLLQLFVCWELVGVSSFLLIGFYHERKTASTAANKAFIMNRIGDAGFLIGLAIAFTQLGTFNLSELTDKFILKPDAGLSHSLWIAMGLGLFAGCVGKSAQVPLQTWLPDAMEGPTPVSALIHAATMVAAGVYLCARCLPFFAPEVLHTIAWIGAITLLLSAATAVAQNDIKRVLAFSTCSQLGYMMLALGLSGYGEGLFHLLTHAFFKALLFLCAGSVIYALHHEQNLSKMGGLWKKLPVTAFTMLIGVAAIVGVPFLSGWYSKDAILALVLEHAQEHHDATFAIIAFGTVILTAYYMSRLWLLAFAGHPRNHHVHDHAHESPFIMTLPLMVLAVFSIGIGWPLIQSHNILEILQTKSHFHDSSVHFQAEVAGGICALIGVAIAVVLHNRGLLLSVKPSLLANRFYFDELYSWFVTKPTVEVSRLTGAFDKSSQPGQQDVTLDGLLTGAGTLVAGTGPRLAPLQSGRLRGYILGLGLAATGGAAILWWFR